MWSNRSFLHITDLESKISKIYRNGSLNTLITVGLIPIIIAYSIVEIKNIEGFSIHFKKKKYIVQKTGDIFLVLLLL